MTHKELAQKITLQIVAKARTEPDPVDWFTRAVSRVCHLEQRAKSDADMDVTAELFKFAGEFGLLPQAMTVEN
jgi:hypothetical protein